MAIDNTVIKEEKKNDAEDINPSPDLLDSDDDASSVDTKTAVEDTQEKESTEEESPMVAGETQKDTSVPEKVFVRCPDCPWKAGLLDENTHCPTCNGTGKVTAEPLE